MSEQWYWQHGRHLLGPLDTASLELLIGQHRIMDRDQVRLANDETWLNGAELKELFAGGERTSSSSEAAARLLSQARKLQNPQTPVRSGGSGIMWTLRVTAQQLLRHAGAPVERLEEGLETGFKFAARVMNAKFLLLLVGVALTFLIVRNLEFGSDARLRRVHSQLSETWEKWDHLRTQDRSDSERVALAKQQLPLIELELQSLIGDSQRAPGRANDSLAWLNSAERDWNVAHVRNALIQASLAMKSILQSASDSDPRPATFEIFQQHMTVANELLGHNSDPTQTGSVDTKAPLFGSDGNARLVLAVIVLDVVIMVAGACYWLRMRR